MGTIKKTIYAYLFTFLSLTMFSCSTEKKDKKEEIAVDSGAPNEDQLLQAGIGKLGKWAEYWESKGANFSIDHFEPSQEHLYEVIEWPEENVLSGENPLKEYQFPNPGSKGVVDIYDYKIVVGEANQVDFDPDAEVVYYKANGMRERLLFIGPSGVFEDAVWISADHLIVSGHLHKEDGYVPIIWLVFPDLNRYVVYENRFSTKDYAPEGYLKEKLKNLRF